MSLFLLTQLEVSWTLINLNHAISRASSRKISHENRYFYFEECENRSGPLGHCNRYHTTSTREVCRRSFRSRCFFSLGTQLLPRRKSCQFRCLPESCGDG